MNKKQMRWVGAAAVIAMGAIFLDAWYLEKYFFEVNRYRIGKKDSDRTVRILLLTDLHFKLKTWAYHKKLARTINSLHPDLILISGDIIDQHGRPGPASRFFSWIDKAIPKLAIPGNHDHVNEVSINTLEYILNDSNGSLLKNETRQLQLKDTVITITGLDDFIEGHSSLPKALRQVDHAPNHFLLVHSPLQQEQVMSELKKINEERSPEQQISIQYIFAGHNHGGQVRLGPIVPVLPEKSGHYINGWYHSEPPFLYVSKGFGTSSVPFRFGARSEITLFTYGV